MDLDAQITDAQLKAHAAKTHDCRMFHAREAVKLKFQRGDLNMIQHLDEVTLEALAMAMIKGETK